MSANMVASNYSIVMPAKNEAEGLAKILPEIRFLHPQAEVIVVDDGSSDSTYEVAISHGATCVRHPISIGNGGAIKTGARQASREFIVFMDADGQHEPKDIERLLVEMNNGFDLVVGARSHKSQASKLREWANRFYNKLASLMTGHLIEDLTSGFRAVRREKFLTILYLLPNKFSYPTTSTMAFFRSGFFVKYIPIEAKERVGKSHIKIFKDGMRFFIIIMKIGALFSPMRVFLPISSFLFFAATSYYLYTYVGHGRFTNMGMLLYMSSLSTFLIGVVSEQISALHYKDTSRGSRIQYERQSIEEHKNQKLSKSV